MKRLASATKFVHESKLEFVLAHPQLDCLAGWEDRTRTGNVVYYFTTAKEVKKQEPPRKGINWLLGK